MRCFTRTKIENAGRIRHRRRKNRIGTVIDKQIIPFLCTRRHFGRYARRHLRYQTGDQPIAIIAGAVRRKQSQPREIKASIGGALTSEMISGEFGDAIDHARIGQIIFADQTIEAAIFGLRSDPHKLAGTDTDRGIDQVAAVPDIIELNIARARGTGNTFPCAVNNDVGPFSVDHRVNGGIIAEVDRVISGGRGNQAVGGGAASGGDNIMTGGKRGTHNGCPYKSASACYQ